MRRWGEWILSCNGCIMGGSAVASEITYDQQMCDESHHHRGALYTRLGTQIHHGRTPHIVSTRDAHGHCAPMSKKIKVTGTCASVPCIRIVSQVPIIR